MQAVLTRGGRRFVGESLLAGVTGRRALVSLWDDPMAHIDADRDADLILVAPATAHLLARCALGLADDLLTTIVLGTSNPVVLAPAMNVRMWSHAATRAHVETLRGRGLTVIEPEAGSLACGEEGSGRLASVAEVVWAAWHALVPQDLAGRRVLVTAGPTREPLDAARHLSNKASGRMGAALAAAAWERGATTTMVAGPGTPACPAGVVRLEASSAADMDALVGDATFDLAFFAAAPADVAPADPAKGKLRKATLQGGGALELTATPDILARARKSHPDAFLVGFSAIAGGPPEQGAAKVAAKGADAVLVNDITLPDAGFAVATNRGTLFVGESARAVGPDTKERFAHELLDLILKVEK